MAVAFRVVAAGYAAVIRLRRSLQSSRRLGVVAVVMPTVSVVCEVDYAIMLMIE